MANREKLSQLAAILRNAEQTCVPIPQISSQNTDLTIPDAYQIQLINIEEKLSRGDAITGKKIGLTSPPMQELLGVNQPDFGHLLKSMEVHNGRTDRNTMVQARAEGEIAFILKEDLPSSGVSPQDVINATDYVVAAIEIVDSRVENWKITIIDTVADNASSGRYILGEQRVDPKTIDLREVEMSFFKNGERINGGKGSAVLGDPAYAVAWLANAMGEFGVPLKKGEVILSGALSAMLPIEAGDVFTASFDKLGEVTVQFE